jgi:hypothetical protein
MKRLAVPVCFLLALVPSTLAQSHAVLDAMNAELARSLDQLKKQPVPPYFLSYEIG